jgi:hypothetical protein
LTCENGLYTEEVSLHSSFTPTSASTVPRAAIEHAYRDLFAIHEAGLGAQFLDEYQAAIVAREWTRNAYSPTDLYRQRSGLDDTTLNEIMAKDSWMTAQEAHNLGLVDEILKPSPKKPSKAAKAIYREPEHIDLAAVAEQIDQLEHTFFAKDNSIVPVAQATDNGTTDNGNGTTDPGADPVASRAAHYDANAQGANGADENVGLFQGAEERGGRRSRTPDRTSKQIVKGEEETTAPPHMCRQRESERSRLSSTSRITRPGDNAAE